MTGDPVGLTPIYAPFQMLVWGLIVAVAAAWYFGAEYLAQRRRK